MTGSTAAFAALRRNWAGLWAEFWAGITDLSALSLWIMLAVATAVSGLTAWLFQPAVMAGPLGDFVPRSGRDADAFGEALQARVVPEQAAQVGLVIDHDDLAGCGGHAGAPAAAALTSTEVVEFRV